MPSANGAVMRACSGSVYSRLKSPVMIVAAGPRQRLERAAVVLRRAGVARVRRALGVDRAQCLDLRRAPRASVVLEVRRDHAHVAERRADDGLDRDARHAGHARVGRKRQQVARTSASPAAATGSCCRTGGAGRPRPDGRPRRRAPPCSPGEVPPAARTGPRPEWPGRRGSGKLSPISCRHSTSKSARRASLRDDPRGVDLLVDTPAPLHVPRDELHRSRFFHKETQRRRDPLCQTPRASLRLLWQGS